MITTCTGCQVRYRLDASKVPNRLVKVRCPECATVFELDGTRRDDPVMPTPPPISEALVESTPLPTPEPVTAAPAPEPVLDELVLEPATAAATVDHSVTNASAPAAAPSPASDAPRPARRRRRDKSEMLARALVSDILVYNKDARDQALSEGNLLEALGSEIKKSWELYKEKVGAEEANNTTHFKDALNEILADGQSLF